MAKPLKQKNSPPDIIKNLFGSGWLPVDFKQAHTLPVSRSGIKGLDSSFDLFHVEFFPEGFRRLGRYF